MQFEAILWGKQEALDNLWIFLCCSCPHLKRMHLISVGYCYDWINWDGTNNYCHFIHHVLWRKIYPYLWRVYYVFVAFISLWAKYLSETTKERKVLAWLTVWEQFQPVLQRRHCCVVYGGRNDSLASIHNAVTPHGADRKKKVLEGEG